LGTWQSPELKRQPEFTAAVLNSGLFLLIPTIWAAYLDYTWTAAALLAIRLQP
jgi:hypothetical protein